MGFLDNSSITVDAILTKRGRQILSQGGDFTITKFSLSDEEIDYTLYDVLFLYHLVHKFEKQIQNFKLINELTRYTYLEKRKVTNNSYWTQIDRQTDAETLKDLF